MVFRPSVARTRSISAAVWAPIRMPAALAAISWAVALGAWPRDVVSMLSILVLTPGLRGSSSGRTGRLMGGLRDRGRLGCR